MTRAEHIMWLAQHAYEVYRDSPGGRWFEEAPPWSELTMDERAAWQRVADMMRGMLMGD